MQLDYSNRYPRPFYDKLIETFQTPINLNYLKKKLYDIARNNTEKKFIENNFLSWVNSYVLYNDRVNTPTKFKENNLQKEMIYLNTQFIKESINFIKDFNAQNIHDAYSYKNNIKGNTPFYMEEPLKVSHKVFASKSIDSDSNLEEWKKYSGRLYTYRDDMQTAYGTYEQEHRSQSQDMPRVSKKMKEGFSNKQSITPNEGSIDLEIGDYSESNGANHIDDLLGGQLMKEMNSVDMSVGKPGFGREDPDSVRALLVRKVFRTNERGIENGFRMGYAPTRYIDYDQVEGYQGLEREDMIRGYSGNGHGGKW
jgi:hypothetical protein